MLGINKVGLRLQLLDSALDQTINLESNVCIKPHKQACVVTEDGGYGGQKGSSDWGIKLRENKKQGSYTFWPMDFHDFKPNFHDKTEISV